MGIAGTSWLILTSLGPLSTGGWAALVAYALVGNARPRLGSVAALVALASLLAVVGFFTYGQAIESGSGGGSRFFAVASYWTVCSARPFIRTSPS